MNDMVSIIIPVYNVAKYLDECIKSCVDQTYRNIEIILVDDCSTDDSYAICADWQSRDARIKLFQNKGNQGAAYSRNLGISVAAGDWLFFADADDILELNLCDRCLCTASVCQGIDAVNFCSKQFAEGADGGKTIVLNQQIWNNVDKLQGAVLTQPYINETYLSSFTASFEDVYIWLHTGRIGRAYEDKQAGYVWRYFFKKELWTENHISFPPIRYGEDMLALMLVLSRCKRIAILADSLYMYRKREGSLMTEKRSAQDQLRQIDIRGEVVAKMSPQEIAHFREIWDGNSFLTIVNAARLHSYREYMLFSQSDEVKRIVKRLEIHRVPNKYKVPFWILKNRLFTIFYGMIQAANKLNLINY